MKETDTLWGIEKTKTSPLYGALVCPIINLWDSPSRTKIDGTARHGAMVEILEKSIGPDDRIYYKIKTPDGLSGWVSEPFLKNAGDMN